MSKKGSYYAPDSTGSHAAAASGKSGMKSVASKFGADHDDAPGPVEKEASMGSSSKAGGKGSDSGLMKGGRAERSASLHQRIHKSETLLKSKK